MKTNIVRNVFIVVLVLGVFVSFWLGFNSTRQPSPISTEAVPRAASPEPTPITPYTPTESVKTLVADNTQFAFDLYQVLKGQEGNLFYSPYSISTALAMTYAGAKEITAQEMAATLHFTLPNEILHPTFNELQDVLEKREGLELSVANSLWGQQGYPFLPDFLKQVEDGYDSPLELVDFATDPELPRQTINDWVAQKTKDRIKDLIPAGGLTEDTRLVLANAIYFNALWQTPFDPKQTKEEPFTLLDGEKTNVPMMFQHNDLPYRKGENYQLVSLPYNGEMSFIAILPDEGKFEEVEAELSAEFFNEVMSQVYDRDVILRMPKFEFEVSTDLVEPMEALGMKTAFAGFRTDKPDLENCRETYKPEFANFSGMDGGYCLYISAIFHKAFVKVEEKGTEAAAATAVVMTDVTSVPPSPLELTLDRPFIFLIRDNQTGSVLFVGRVLSPIN
jgi:serpin B